MGIAVGNVGCHVRARDTRSVITVPLDGRDSGTNGTGGHADLSTALTSAIEALALAARDAQAF
jgi:hypothetical protein